MGMLEAMSWRLPVIATPVGGIPEVLRDGQNGLSIPTGDPDALAAAMSRLAEDDTLRQRLGDAARLSVEPLDARRYGQRLAELYRSVHERGRRATERA
jgi:glycosyltransferase involved in cell wall biosynthesis